MQSQQNRKSRRTVELYKVRFKTTYTPKVLVQPKDGMYYPCVTKIYIRNHASTIVCLKSCDHRFV